jgi:hypothetical protein
MPKSSSPPPATQPPTEVDPPYTTGMRIYGGVTWGSLTTLVIAAILITIPQVPRPWLWSIPLTWVALMLLGIALQWSVARGPCPKCGHHQMVTTQLKRCPSCRSYLKAMNRKIVRVG